MDELKQLLRDEVDRLPVHYRTPLILYYFGELSTEQIAVELKTSAKALARPPRATSWATSHRRRQPPDPASFIDGQPLIDITPLLSPTADPPASQPIPEPSAASVLALSAAGLLARRRRRPT